MKKTALIVTLLLQVFITYIVLLTIYMLYALFDIDEADMINGLGFLLFQPLLGFMLASVTIIICLLIGLPLRLVEKLKAWWIKKPFIALAGFIAGLLLLTLAFYPAWMETQQVIIDGEPMEKLVPNTFLALIGWFTTAFSLLHFYPLAVFQAFKK